MKELEKKLASSGSFSPNIGGSTGNNKSPATLTNTSISNMKNLQNINEIIAKHELKSIQLEEKRDSIIEAKE